MAANLIGSLVGGGQQEQPRSNLHLVNPGQQALWNQMASRAAGGAGEFGFGQAAKQAKGQVQQMLADRGVDMGSGFAAGAMGNAFSNAAAQDQAARNQFNLNLLNTPLQVAQTTGGNFIPGSPSAGFSSGAQEGSWNQFQSTGWTPGGMGPNSYTGHGWNTRPQGWNNAQGNSADGWWIQDPVSPRRTPRPQRDSDGWGGGGGGNG
jgi:hypothetical protein